MIRTAKDLSEALALKQSIVSEAALHCLLCGDADWSSTDEHAVIAAAVLAFASGTFQPERGILNEELSLRLTAAVGEVGPDDYAEGSGVP